MVGKSSISSGSHAIVGDSNNPKGFSSESFGSWSSYWATRNPSNLVANVISESEINVTWADASASADGLKIYLSTNGGVTYTYKSTIAFGVGSAALTGLTELQLYTIKLVAYKGTHESVGVTTTATPEKWYLADGVTSSNAVGVYKPAGAGSLNASYSNIANPGTNDAIPEVAPTFDDTTGWIFGGTNYLSTGLIPTNDQTWSMIIKYSHFSDSAGQKFLAGLYHDADRCFGISLLPNQISMYNGGGGAGSVFNITIPSSGVLCISGKNTYLDGIALGGQAVVGTGNYTYDIIIGADHYASILQFFTGRIQSIAIYNCTLTESQVGMITARMNNSYITYKVHYDSQSILKQNYVNNAFGAFVCFNMPSFFDHTKEVADSNLSVDSFAPSDMDIDDWLDSAVLAGMKYAVLTVKHHDGFKLWVTASKVGANIPYCISGTTWYSVTNIDILSSFASKCRLKGLKVGVYYSILDNTWAVQSSKTYATDTPGYITMLTTELTEILSNYGVIDSLWFDGWAWSIGYEYIYYKMIYDLVKSIQPNCIIVENSHRFPTTTSQILTFEAPTADGNIPLGNTELAEECNTIRTAYTGDSWFYHSDLGQTVNDFKSKSTINTEKNNVIARMGAFLLAITPDTTGHLPSAQKALLESLNI
jgi:alpha-L-fucosidase